MGAIKGARVLVTGGAGFIGSHIVDALLERSCTVTILDDLSNGKRDNIEHHSSHTQLKLVVGSVLNESHMSDAMCAVDIVIHCATLGVRHSIKAPFENHRVNAEGALRVLQAAHDANIKRFIYCSSSEIYGTARTVPMNEQHPTCPHTVYGAGKLAGEAYARAFQLTYGLPTTVVRPFNVYGPRSHHEGDAGEIIPRAIVRALNGVPIIIFGDGSQTRDFTYVTDVARAFIAVLEHDDLVGETCNIGSQREHSIKNIAEYIQQLVNHPTQDIQFVAARPGDVMRLCADTTFVSQCTKWKPLVSWHDGLTETIEWFRTRPAGIEQLLQEAVTYNWE